MARPRAAISTVVSCALHTVHCTRTSNCAQFLRHLYMLCTPHKSVCPWLPAPPALNSLFPDLCGCLVSQCFSSSPCHSQLAAFLRLVGAPNVVCCSETIKYVPIIKEVGRLIHNHPATCFRSAPLPSRSDPLVHSLLAKLWFCQQVL